MHLADMLSRGCLLSEGKGEDDEYVNMVSCLARRRARRAENLTPVHSHKRL